MSRKIYQINGKAHTKETSGILKLKEREAGQIIYTCDSHDQQLYKAVILNKLKKSLNRIFKQIFKKKNKF